MNPINVYFDYILYEIVTAWREKMVINIKLELLNGIKTNETRLQKKTAKKKYIIQGIVLERIGINHYDGSNWVVFSKHLSTTLKAIYR